MERSYEGSDMPDDVLVLKSHSGSDQEEGTARPIFFTGEAQPPIVLKADVQPREPNLRQQKVR